MSVTVTYDRIKRLVDSGFRGRCQPAERVSQLKRKVNAADDLKIARMEQLFFGLADRTRLLILQLLQNQELCACEITAALDLTQPTTSHHLGILEKAALIGSRRDGKWIFYRLADPNVKALLVKASALVKGAT